jgi:hypothetical protein
MATEQTSAALILSIVTDNGNMDRDELDQDMLAAALADGVVVDCGGFIYPATSRHAR